MCGDAMSNSVDDMSGDQSIEAEIEQIDTMPPADLHRALPEPSLPSQAMVVTMTGDTDGMNDVGTRVAADGGAGMQDQPASLLNSLSPLSPIREVAEGASTPKVIDAREVQETQEARDHYKNNASWDLAATGQPDVESKDAKELDEDSQDFDKDDAVVGTADPLAQLPSSKERYLQIRDRFLAK